ncbi:MAG: hypothetical protein WA063_05280 [Minisyncoccia bacterium]
MNNFDNPTFQEANGIRDGISDIPNFEPVVNSEKNEERIKATPEQCEHEDKKLEIFADVIGDCEYYIGGGLAVELEKRKIEHVHDDIDIIVFEDELERLKRKLLSKGFNFEKNKNTHDYDSRQITNENTNKVISDSPHIGIFVYKKSKENNTAEQLNEDGSINKKFPLDYFDTEKQMVEYNQNKLRIADLRLVLGLKMISERPKDAKDIKKIKESLMAKYQNKKILSEEMEKLKVISQENIKTQAVSDIRNIISKLKNKEEINRDNISEHFGIEARNSIKNVENAKYKNAIYRYLERIKAFPVRDEQTKKDFEDFALNNTESLVNYYNSEVEIIINDILN